MVGHSGADSWIEQAIGSVYDDVLTGNARDNLLQGKGGNDAIDAGAGQDTVGFAGRFSDYTISTSFDTLQVAARDGLSGFSTLRNVEILSFGDGSRMLLGDAGANTLSAAAGNDLLLGGAGNDTLDGGAGLDVASFSAVRSNYTISKTASGFSITDLSGVDGVDQLLNMERLQFSDQAVALDISGVGGRAYRIDQTAFDRAPNPIGLGVLDRHAVSRAEVLAEFSESSENQVALASVIGQGFSFQPYTG